MYFQVVLYAHDCSCIDIDIYILIGCKHRANEGEFYIRRWPRFCMPIHWVGYVCALRVYICIAEYRIGRMFGYT